VQLLTLHVVRKSRFCRFAAPDCAQLWSRSPQGAAGIRCMGCMFHEV
jgi:hypothetical protein